MNWKRFVLLGCVPACVFAASPAAAQMRGHGGSMGRTGMRGGGMGMRGGGMPHSMGGMPMRGGFMSRSMGRMPMHRGPMPGSMGRMPMHRAPMLSSMGRMPMHRDPMLNSASGFRHPFFRDRREDRFEARDPFNNDRFFFNNDRFFNNRTFVFAGDFGFPWWWGWGWGPWWGWNWDYQYGYYGGYGSGYGYGDSSQSRVAELQRRLARAGYYHGSIDGIMGPQTRRAIRAYERDHGGSAYGAIDQRLPFENQNKSQLLGC